MFKYSSESFYNNITSKDAKSNCAKNQTNMCIEFNLCKIMKKICKNEKVIVLFFNFNSIPEIVSNYICLRIPPLYVSNQKA